MKFIRHLRYEGLPSPEYTGEEHKDEALVREFDEAFDRLAAALGQLYLVDTEGGCEIEAAPISMCRYVDICRHHTIVVERQAWDPDVIQILHEQLQQLPAGWTFGIDATDFPTGQAHIVVEQDGTVHGWCDFPAGSILSVFGFKELRGPFRIARFKTVSFIDRLKRK